MKKYIALLTALSLIFALCPAVMADGEPTFGTVGITFYNEVDWGMPKLQTLVFELRDADSGEALDTESLEYTEVFEYFHRLEFTVPEYSAGKRFVLALTQGEAELLYNGAEAPSFELQTYSYLDGEDMRYVTEFYMDLRPATERTVNISIGGGPVSGAVYPYPTDILVPVSSLGNVDINAEYIEYDGVMLTAGDASLLFYPGINTAYKNWQPISIDLAPTIIDGAYYVPAGVVAAAFECPFYYSDDGRTLNLGMERTPLAQTEDEKRINSRGVSSDTPYLIWVSKSEFRVRVYTGYTDHWKLVDSFPCAIGAPGTPTIEGTFKYYQKQDRWEYSSYYCGPIMRFKNGYALHSVLIRYNGSYYDGRVGVRISHGCVRLLPENIRWMADTIPLRTTVYVTA